MSRSVFLVAGEASGDLHGSRLIEEMTRRDPELRFEGYGGVRMEAAGMTLHENLAERSVMGFFRVLGDIGFFLRLTARFIERMRTDPPDVVVLIDYPGLNRNLARIARRHGVRVVYYICPQVWAWAPWRARSLARLVDQLLVIIPFEKELYDRVHPRVEYVGSPVFDNLHRIERDLPAESLRPGRKILALFPGSRVQEVEGALPKMLTAIQDEGFRELDVIVSCQRDRLRPEIERCIANASVEAEILEGDAHRLQRDAYLSLVVSGTATLEQAYFGVPMVVLYPATPGKRRLFRWVSVTPHVALVNLFAGKEIVPEFLLAEGEEDQLADAARQLLDGDRRDRVRADLAAVKEAHFVPGASRRASGALVDFLNT